MKETKFLITYLFLATCMIVQAQKLDINTYTEKVEGGYNVYVDNNELTPVSIKISFTLTNLKSIDNNNTIYVIPAKTKRHLATSLSILKQGKSYKYSYTTLYNRGNHHKEVYDVDYPYDLPYKKGQEFQLYQGYNGKSTHQNQNALDFKMPVGTPILAARGGLITNVIVNNSKNCFKKECKKFNNLITIYHDDGTFADYAHLKYKGAAVQVGAKVSQGQLLGYSGNVGYSNGPHLHFVVYRQLLDQLQTIKTKFKTGTGDTTIFLKEKESYHKTY